MRILLTNDDGIHAAGLMALYRELKADFEVDVVAPETEMSAIGHAITLTSPLRVQEIKKNGAFFGFGVKGTPADCVQIALLELLEHPPDIVLSGINLGANVGVNVLYSGTVSAATEGACFGIKSAAISLNTLRKPDFTFAARFSREIIAFMTRNGLKEGTALNVNIPSIPPEKMTGVSITRQGIGKMDVGFERRVDPRGNVYYWLTGETPVGDEALDTDAGALGKGRITITPINYDLTCPNEIRRLRSCSLPTFK